MAKLTIEIPDPNEAGWLYNGLTKKWNYQANDGEGNPNPESKEDFIGRLITDYLIKEAIQGYMTDKHIDLVNLANQIIINYGTV
jgi:hypothetical protein